MKTRYVCAMLVLLTGLGAARAADDGSSFTITPDYSYKTLFHVYEKLKARNRAQFVTTDVALHGAHLLFDYSLRLIELDELDALAKKLTRAMVENCVRNDIDLKTGRDLQAFFSVAAKCLDPDFEVPADVAARVAKDLALMEKHEGGAISATLDNGEDFSQYIPRGHYTRNETFKRYFKAMMWYGRRMFRVEEVRPDCVPPPLASDRWSDAHKRHESRCMLLITWLLHHVKVDGEPAIKTWDKLYIPTVQFAGRTEDLNPHEVKALAEKVWGKLPGPAELEPKKLDRFIRVAAGFSKPKIDSFGAGRKGFCFMAQRFTPDSFVTQCLVTDADTPFGAGVPAHPLVYAGSRRPRPFTWGSNMLLRPPERRFMPRGLDVMAVFGCDLALDLLKADGDTAYKGYDAMLAFLRKDVGRMMAERKDENLYYAWLHALQPLMQPITSAKVPGCLRSTGWQRKQLATSLASWAELRHDTILYVKQSYTPAPRSARPTPLGYVEPQPEVFRRIAQMMRKMERDLGALGVMPAALKGRYEQFAVLCDKLAAVADKELAGKPLERADLWFVSGAALALQRAAKLPRNAHRRVASAADSGMALVADVHTDTNAGVVLEEGVGTPFLLSVKMPVNGRTVTLQGAVFSYYEFKHPMKDRLTDEAWQKMLASDKRPTVPAWYPVKGE